jgi:hypothetical protein
VFETVRRPLAARSLLKNFEIYYYLNNNSKFVDAARFVWVRAVRAWFVVIKISEMEALPE